MKTKKKDWKIKSFSLEIDTTSRLKELADYEGLSESNFIDFLINQWDMGIDPNKRLKQLQKSKKELNEKQAEIDGEIEKTLTQISLFADWNKKKQVKKQEAIQILENLIINREYEKAEKISKTWQRITGTSNVELLVEAKQNLEKKGI